MWKTTIGLAYFPAGLLSFAGLLRRARLHRAISSGSAQFTEQLDLFNALPTREDRALGPGVDEEAPLRAVAANFRALVLGCIETKNC